MAGDRAQGELGSEEHHSAAGTGIDTTMPHSARMWNYWLGGKDNFAADRAVGDQFSAIYPGIVNIARADRAFLGRVIRYLTGEAGIRQFLDVGTGLPTADNTHQVAQAVAPQSRVVYVDNDPLVLTHARALLTSSAQGATCLWTLTCVMPGRCSQLPVDQRQHQHQRGPVPDPDP